MDAMALGTPGVKGRGRVGGQPGWSRACASAGGDKLGGGRSSGTGALVIFRCSRALFLFLWVEAGTRRTEAAEEWSGLEETARQPEGAGEQGKLC